MSVNLKKVDAIREMGAPKSKKELESFQGMVNYLNHFSSWCTQVAEPLKETLRNDTLWCWESVHQEEFKAIKEELTKTLLLVHFDPNADHIIQVNGSMKVLDAVLLQKSSPFIYVSRILTPAETGYSNIEKELLSVEFGLEGLHHYIFGSRVEV